MRNNLQGFSTGTFLGHIRLHGYAGEHFDVKGWSPKIDMDISEDPENQRMFAGDKVSIRMVFVESRLYMAMQRCIFMLWVGTQKSIETFLRSPKKA